MPKQDKKKGPRCSGHPYVWAFLTLVTFPIVLITTDKLGAEGIWPFILAIVATLLVLALEAMVRGKLWPFEPEFEDCLGHPATPIRILLFLGGTLLILESALIFIVATNRHMDPALLGMMARRHCADADDAASGAFCRYASNPDWTGASADRIRPNDTMSYTVRLHAARSWFPNEPLATCAWRSSDVLSDGATTKLVGLMHCTAWRDSGDGTLKSKTTKSAFVGASMTKGDDGLYRVTGWSDDANAPTWDSALGDMAERARDRVRTFGVFQDLITIMQAECLGRAQEVLRK